MGAALTRIGAVLLGAIVLGFALLGTFGTTILVPLAMLAAWYLAHRRGRRLTALQGWTAGVLTFGVLVTVGLAWAVFIGPLHGKVGKFESDMDKAVQEAQKRPIEQPAFLRRLNAQPPPPLPASMAKPLMAASALFGLELWCLFFGTVAWGGVSLLVFGVRGPRPHTPDLALALPLDPLA
jgi:hypothetical protein